MVSTNVNMLKNDDIKSRFCKKHQKGNDLYKVFEMKKKQILKDNPE